MADLDVLGAKVRVFFVFGSIWLDSLKPHWQERAVGGGIPKVDGGD